MERFKNANKIREPVFESKLEAHEDVEDVAAEDGGPYVEVCGAVTRDRLTGDRMKEGVYYSWS